MMKNLGVLFFVAAVLMGILCAGVACDGGQETPTPTPTATATPTAIAIPPSTIASVSGQVFVLKPGAGSWVDAVEGWDLEVGDSVQTGGKGYAVLVLFDGSVMEMEEFTKVSVVELGMTEAGATSVGLTQEVGRTINRVEQLVDPESSYEVETPAGVAVVRGTRFDLDVNRKGVTVLYVDDGEACFEARGQTRCAMGGFEITTVPGSAPSPAQSTAPPPAGPPGGDFGFIPLQPLPTPTATPPGPVFTPMPTPTPTPTPVAMPPSVDVTITSPANGSEVGDRLATVEGTVVSDNPINQASITHDGGTRPLDLTYEGEGSHHYSFATPVELHQGQNEITVTAVDSVGTDGSDTITVYASIKVTSILIELTWDTDGTDLDGHFVRPGGTYYQVPDDCCWFNMNPDWDGSGGGGTAGDPSLDVDDTNGYGPEYTALVEPPYDGSYEYIVHYFDYCQATTTAEVRIWLNDVLVATYHHTFLCGSGAVTDPDVWECACIEWDESTGSVSAGPCPALSATPTPEPTPTPAATPNATPTPRTHDKA